MEKFINPFTDYGFKAIFGTEVNKDIIISFLNSLIGETITDITFHNVEALGMNRISRKAIFDIFCQNEKGEFFIVEMQQTWQRYFTDRVLFYASFPIQYQNRLPLHSALNAVALPPQGTSAGGMKDRVEEVLADVPLQDMASTSASSEDFRHADEPKHAKWDYHIQKVYVVCILNFVMDRSHPEKYRWDVVRMDRELKEPFSETLNEIYLEMPKFKLPLEECDTLYKKWLYVLNNIEIMARLPEELNNQIFQRLKSIVEVERMTLDERLAYETSLSEVRDIYNIADSHYEKGLEEGEVIGLQKGEEIGRQKGEEIGRQKGEEIGRRQSIRDMAAALKENGADPLLIRKVTGLSPEEIDPL